MKPINFVKTKIIDSEFVKKFDEFVNDFINSRHSYKFFSLVLVSYLITTKNSRYGG